MDLFILYNTEDLKINNRLCWLALTLTLQGPEGDSYLRTPLLFHNNPAS